MNYATWLKAAVAGAAIALSTPVRADDVPLYHDKGFWAQQFQAVGDAAKEKTGVRIVQTSYAPAGTIQGLHPVLDRVWLTPGFLHLVDRRDLQGTRRHRQNRATRRCLGTDDFFRPVREVDAGPVQG